MDTQEDSLLALEFRDRGLAEGLTRLLQRALEADLLDVAELLLQALRLLAHEEAED